VADALETAEPLDIEMNESAGLGILIAVTGSAGTRSFIRDRPACRTADGGG
jgi:hypothetical protein